MRARKQIGRSEFYLWEISEVKNSSCAAVRCCVLAIVVTRTTGRQLNSNSVRCVARCASGPQMWRKVALTGVVSVVAPGSLVQIMVASTISLCFFGMHARCWPFKDEASNLLKLGCEFALVVSFLCTALLRSVATKQALVDAGRLQPEDMTSEEKIMPAGGYAARGHCTPRGVQHSCLRECQLTPLERVSPNSASSVEHPVLSTILVVVCTCLPGPSVMFCRTESDLSLLVAAVSGTVGCVPGVAPRVDTCAAHDNSVRGPQLGS